jgi:hypothetical protein
VLESTKALLWGFFPGVALGFTMIPWWWWLIALSAMAAGLGVWRRSKISPRRKWMTVVLATSTAAAGFFLAAAWSADDSCSQTADGLCVLAGLPCLAACAALLLVALVGVIQTLRLGKLP